MVGNFEKIETPNLRPRSVKNPRGRIRRLVRGIAGHKITGLIPRPVMLPGAKWSFPLPLDDNLNVDQNPVSGFICFASLPQTAQGANHFQPHSGLDFRAFPVVVSIHIKPSRIQAMKAALSQTQASPLLRAKENLRMHNQNYLPRTF